MAQRDAVEYVHFAALHGSLKCDAAAELSLSARTLRSWQLRLRSGEGWALRGRPLRRSSPQERNAILKTIDAIGPQVGVQILRRQHPRAARGELRDLLERRRALYVLQHPVIQEKLTWLVPGAVWAVDHTKASGRIDGSAVLSVRDLSSGAQLLWIPTSSQEAPECVVALQELHERFGAPLVLKADGGPAFRDTEFLDLLGSWGVKVLVSPRYYPQYNGAVESGMGWQKLRTDHQGRRSGHPGQWSVADMQRAQRVANEFGESPLDPQRSPLEVWNSRKRISESTRRAFLQRVNEEAVRARLELGRVGAEELRARERAQVDRTAIRRALVAHGILQYRRRRVSLPFWSRKAARIS